MLVQNKWSNLMKNVRNNRDRRNSRVKLNMDLCLLQIESLYEANNENTRQEDDAAGVKSLYRCLPTQIFITNRWC